MSAIFGFTFHIGRMTEVLTPDIYRAHWVYTIKVFKGTDSVVNTESFSSNISYQFFKTENLPMQNSYCDHRNFDSVNQPLA